MACLVHKYGGSSLASPAHINAIAARVRDCRAAGHRVAVVVSAINEETDRLLALAATLGAASASIELDTLLATGEQASAALLCLALQRIGVEAASFSGTRQPIQSGGEAGRALITAVHADALREMMARNAVPVVAGFQGIAADGTLQTLGRGGSDTSAVAVALALNADECRIYTDVDGICSANPKLVAQTQLRHQLDFEEVLEMASSGAKVLQYRAAALSGRHGLKLRVLSSMTTGDESHDASAGTLVAKRNHRSFAADHDMEQPDPEEKYQVVENANEAQVAISGVPDQPGVAADILSTIAARGIQVDLIVQNTGHDRISDLSFTVPRSEVEQAETLAQQAVNQIGAGSVQTDCRIAKVALVGYGLRSQAGVAGKMFATLAKHKVNIKMIATSEVRIAVIVQEDDLKAAVRALHAAFCE